MLYISRLLRIILYVHMSSYLLLALHVLVVDLLPMTATLLEISLRVAVNFWR
jgi:hypothetical protein